MDTHIPTGGPAASPASAPVRLWFALLVAALMLPASVAAAAAGQSPDPSAAAGDPAGRRVRHTGDPLIAELIEEGIRRSPSFRSLVDTIDRTDGLVYVERGQCQTAVQACLSLRVGVAGPNRILRIVINANRDRAGLIGAIGHELHHAADALSNPNVRTVDDMFFHFLPPGTTLEASGRNRLETRGAVAAGLQIERELKSQMSEAPNRTAERASGDGNGPGNR